MSQLELAIALGVPQSSISRYESGLTTPGTKVMVRIFEFTNGAVSANDLYSAHFYPEREAAQ